MNIETLGDERIGGATEGVVPGPGREGRRSPLGHHHHPQHRGFQLPPLVSRIRFVISVFGVLTWTLSFCWVVVEEDWAALLFGASYLLLLANLLVPFYRAIWTPPGRPSKANLLPKGLAEELIELRRRHESLGPATFAEMVTLRESRLAAVMKEQGLIYKERDWVGHIRWCEPCEALKPDRAHHCSVCGNCVLRMDHHCVVINNCVGYANHKYFVLLLAYTGLGCTYGGCVSAAFLVAELTTGNKRLNGTHLGLTMALVCLNLWLGLTCAAFAGYEVWLAARNRTQLELILDQHRRAAPGAPDRHNQYRLGPIANLRQMFGRNLCSALLPFQSSEGDGENWPTNEHSPV